MRILISDYSGHPFQVQLSRELARRGHEVCHVSSASFQTPKGRLDRGEDDPENFSSVTVRNAKAFNKKGFLSRALQEDESGRRIAEHIAYFRPDVVISSNAPLGTQRVILRETRRANSKFVFWIQDLYGKAMRGILRRRLGPIGSFVGARYEALERRMLQRSDHVVAISDLFLDPLREFGIAGDDVTVIQNWAPIDEMSVPGRENAWSMANLPANRKRAIYSGTLGYKHNPMLLLDLAREFDGDVLVFSEGEAAEDLKRQATEEGLANLKVQGWVAFDVLPSVLAAGDILLVLLEPDAGAYSVPSKVLTYLCIGRPIVGSIRNDNLAANIIAEARAGITVEPGDRAGFVSAANRIASDEAIAADMGKAARRYAERTFAIETIGDRFEEICQKIS